MKLTFSEPFLNNEIKFLKRADSDIQFRNVTDLTGLRIGVVNDFAYSREAVDTTGIVIKTAGSVRANIDSLLAGELDLVLADSRVAMYEANQMVAARNVTLLPEPFITRKLRIAVSTTRLDHKEIVKAFDAAIASMRSDGSYNQLLATYRISQ
jgi:polar amino acid transport system substrate-binding protein